jgi:hypothetical protein
MSFVLSRPCARPPHGRRPVRGDPGKAQERGTVRLWPAAATSGAAGLWVLGLMKNPVLE